MSIVVSHIKDLYDEFINSKVAKSENPMSIPRLKFISLNVGCGRLHKDSNRLDYIEEELDKIAGQKCVRTKIRKSISNFSIREGMIVGMKVTLRREKMFDFLTRLIMIALPRMNDFNGIKLNSFDKAYNLNFGLDRQDIFPESDGRHLFGMNICIGIDAKAPKGKQTDEIKNKIIELLKHIQMPIMTGGA